MSNLDKKIDEILRESFDIRGEEDWMKDGSCTDELVDAGKQLKLLISQQRQQAISQYKDSLVKEIEKLKIYPLIVGLAEMDDERNTAVSRDDVISIIQGGSDE